MKDESFARCVGETGRVGLEEKGKKGIEKRVAFLVIDEDIPLLDTSNHYVL